MDEIRKEIEGLSEDLYQVRQELNIRLDIMKQRVFMGLKVAAGSVAVFFASKIFLRIARAFICMVWGKKGILSLSALLSAAAWAYYKQNK
ncbi:MAG: hypothetical protein U9P80_10510 [Thermodesulfobacteriota bacterium]|nr:hypothetical protein [Thermodesulfobacteriota bacterium]